MHLNWKLELNYVIAFHKPVVEAWKLIDECHTRNIISDSNPYVQQEWNCCFNWLMDIVFHFWSSYSISI